MFDAGDKDLSSHFFFNLKVISRKLNYTWKRQTETERKRVCKSVCERGGGGGGRDRERHTHTETERRR